MFQLFQSIFSTSREDSLYPEELINRAVERAVDVVDPRLRALSGYQKKLRSAIIHALDQVVKLVDSLPVSLQLNKVNFLSQPELTAYFSSYSDAQKIISLDPILNQWLESPDNSPHKNGHNVVMLLLMEMQEHNGFGMALEGDMLRRDVPQTTINFAHHRLVDPTVSEEDTRRLLKRRAFDHLLELTLQRLATKHSQQAELEKEHFLLKKKYSTLQSGHWGFDEINNDELIDPQTLQQQLKEIESQLLAVNAGSGLLNSNLNILVDVLMMAELNLWKEHDSIIMNKMHIKQKQISDDAPEIHLTVLHNITGKKLIAQLVTIAYEDLPPLRDFIHEAEKYLR